MSNEIYILECTLCKKPDIVKVRKAVFVEDIDYYLAQGWDFINKEEQDAYYKGEENDRT